MDRLTSKLFIPILMLSFVTFGLSFDRFIIDRSIGVNAYLIIFIGFLITITGLFILKSLAIKYPDRSIIGLGDKLLGPIGKIGTPLWFILIFLLTVVLARRVTDEVSTVILFRTPGLVSILGYFLIVGYMALLGEEALGRLSSVLMMAIPVFLILLVLSFREINFLNIHPVNIYRNLGYLRKWDLWLLIFTPVWILSAFFGTESIRNEFKKVILTIIIGTLILGATFLAIAGVFGPRGIERYQWPVMSLMNITEFASSYLFLNAITTVFFFVFLALSLVTTASFLIFLAKGLGEFLGLKNNQSKIILLAITAGLFALTAIPSLINFLETTSLLLKVASIYTPIYILLIWFSSLLRRKDH
ncbi:MAG TPA: hypothetical protein DDW65_15695 [Firmicutes bacterium]|jgi:hypothetical protein|nr:hypothetical protein [Bacillota bacterium]